MPDVPREETRLRLLFLNPLNKMDDFPRDIPFHLARLVNMVATAGHEVDLMDLNILRELNRKEAIIDVIKTEGVVDENRGDYDLAWLSGPFSTFAEISRTIDLLRGITPDMVTVVGGKIGTYAPTEVLKSMKGLDIAVSGDEEDTLTEIIERVPGQRWGPIKGISFREGKGIRRNPPREPKEDVESLPYPNYTRDVQLQRYFQLSPMMICPEAITCKRRLSFSWQRDYVSPFPSDNGKLIGRFPTPKYAIKNITEVRYKQAIDFATLIDKGITSNMEWFSEFVQAYMEEDLYDIVSWSCWVDPEEIWKNPKIARTMKDAGCRAVLMELDGPTNAHHQTTIDMFKQVGISIALRFVVGTPTQQIDDLISMADLCITNKMEPYEVVQPNLYPDGPYFEAYKDDILAPYLGDLSAFLMDEPRNNQVSWTGGLDFADSIALRSMVRTRDMANLLRFTHRRALSHSPAYGKYCPICKLITEGRKTVIKATKILQEAVSESRIPPDASKPTIGSTRPSLSGGIP